MKKQFLVQTEEVHDVRSVKRVRQTAYPDGCEDPSTKHISLGLCVRLEELDRS